MMHYYCMPIKFTKLKNDTTLEKNIYFNFIREITNTFEVYQVFRPDFLHKIIKKQKITSQEIDHCREKVSYRIKSSSLREWEAFDCYCEMESDLPSYALVIEEPKIILCITYHCFIHLLIDDVNITKIDPIIKKYNFCLTQSISKNIKKKRIYAKPRKLSNQQVLNLIGKDQYELLVYFSQIDQILSYPHIHNQKDFNYSKKWESFFITLWDHWIKDDREFKELITEYCFNSYLLKTHPSLMQQKQINEDQLLNFLLWLFSKYKSYEIYFDDEKLILREISQQYLINQFYMGIRLGRGCSFYFPEAKILIYTIAETYCIEVIVFDKNQELEIKIKEMGLYALQ